MPRLFLALCIAIALTLFVGWIAPHQLAVTLYKISLVSLAAVAGYWIDRAVFPYARPHDLMPMQQTDSDWLEAPDSSTPADEAMLRRENELMPMQEASLITLQGPASCTADMAMLRRAIIMAAVILAVALGA